MARPVFPLYEFRFSHFGHFGLGEGGPAGGGEDIAKKKTTLIQALGGGFKILTMKGWSTAPYYLDMAPPCGCACLAQIKQLAHGKGLQHPDTICSPVCSCALSYSTTFAILLPAGPLAPHTRTYVHKGRLLIPQVCTYNVARFLVHLQNEIHSGLAYLSVWALKRAHCKRHCGLNGNRAKAQTQMHQSFNTGQCKHTGKKRTFPRSTGNACSNAFSTF